jgi:hypothetical protein
LNAVDPALKRLAICRLSRFIPTENVRDTPEGLDLSRNFPFLKSMLFELKLQLPSQPLARLVAQKQSYELEVPTVW